jgi:hypothetical protein
MTVGAALANKIAGLIMRKGKRNVKIMPMLSSAITLNMSVLFFKKGLLLHFCDFVVITQLAFVLYMKACLCIVPGSINYILHEELAASALYPFYLYVAMWYPGLTVLDVDLPDAYISEFVQVYTA